MQFLFVMAVQVNRGLVLYIFEEIAASRAAVRTSAKNQDFPHSETLIFLLVGAAPNPPESVETDWLHVLKNAMIDAPRVDRPHIYAFALHFRFSCDIKENTALMLQLLDQRLYIATYGKITYAAYAELSHDFRYTSNPKKETLQA